MIKRAPRPKVQYSVYRHDVVRDPNLSYRASGVLADILSRPDNWTATAESLAAARPGMEGVKALRTALRELEKAGYLRRERIRTAEGRFTWAQTIYDAPITDTPPESADVSAGQTISPKPPGGFPPDGFGPSKEVSRRSTEKKEMNWPDSARCAPGVGAHQTDDHDFDDEASGATPPPPEPATTARVDDRATFKAILGETIRSAGMKEWNTGIFATDAVYDALRTKGQRRKRIDWPGAYLARIDEGPTPAGLDRWLDEQGFEMVDSHGR